MPTATYLERRGELEHYFDRAAAATWARLTSDAPVSRIRATVRAGRERMRAQLLDWLPRDLTGKRLLDAGCGTGVLALAAAARGASVLAVDLAGTLLELARARADRPGAGTVEFIVGDMCDPRHGEFDYIVAMDSLIHYEAQDMAHTLGELAGRTRHAILFTYAPRTPALALMHAVGRLFPRSDRAPAIQPISATRLARVCARQPGLEGWQAARGARIDVGFYKSHALELVRR